MKAKIEALKTLLDDERGQVAADRTLAAGLSLIQVTCPSSRTLFLKSAF